MFSENSFCPPAGKPASWQAPTLHLAARQLLVVGEEVAVPLVDLACPGPVKGYARYKGDLRVQPHLP